MYLGLEKRIISLGQALWVKPEANKRPCAISRNTTFYTFSYNCNMFTEKKKPASQSPGDSIV